MLKFFSLKGCSPCHQMEDLLDEMNISYEKIDVSQLDYVIGGVPLLVYMDNTGKELSLRGYESEEKVKQWLSHIL